MEKGKYSTSFNRCIRILSEQKIDIERTPPATRGMMKNIELGISAPFMDYPTLNDNLRYNLELLHILTHWMFWNAKKVRELVPLVEYDWMVLIAIMRFTKRRCPTCNDFINSKHSNYFCDFIYEKFNELIQ